MLFDLQDSAEWKQRAHRVHQRTADRILVGCLKNGGLYIKLGQGLVSFNHILPTEYLDTLQVLYDKAPARRKNEVSIYIGVVISLERGADLHTLNMCVSVFWFFIVS